METTKLGTLTINGKERRVKFTSYGGNGGYSVSVGYHNDDHNQQPIITWYWRPEVKDHPDRYIADHEEEQGWRGKPRYVRTHENGERVVWEINETLIEAAKKTLIESGYIEQATTMYDEEYGLEYSVPTQEEHEEMERRSAQMGPFAGVKGGVAVVGDTNPPQWYEGKATCLSCGGQYTYDEVKKRGGTWQGTVCECGC